MNQFELGKTWSAELTGFFPGSQFFAQTKSGSVYNISCWLAKNHPARSGNSPLNRE
ncbi:hypothetical protein GO730_02365 [Spirosoma sp. HMF3257]|uniref:hypothetical protein n=1 Tax=Spirosoma telluris TaxID=2183553 RepID=UPI0012FB1A8A|nr:hypothetical protein [Spirosoma telluris]